VKTIGFSLLGGPHQFLHSLPVAASLSARNLANVVLYANNAADLHKAVNMMRNLGATHFTAIEMTLPAWLSWPAMLNAKWQSLKLMRLLWWSRQFTACDALIVTERTSTALKKLSRSTPPLFHIPHGAGDRAKGFEKRISHFDLVIVAGVKDRYRLIADGIISEDRIAVSGYVKMSALQVMHQHNACIFDNDRPTILYNAHFSPALSSWIQFGLPLIKAIIRDGNFNLIVAPHIRMFEGVSAAQRAEWEALASADHVIVDLGSDRLLDGTYTRMADIYLGDVSSQVYEFTAKPRPCVFLNAHGADWKHDPNYRMWHFGDVADTVDSAVEALRNAALQFVHYHQRQCVEGEDAFGIIDGKAPERAADIIMQRLG
jgi:hypothetical protein